MIYDDYGIVEQLLLDYVKKVIISNKIIEHNVTAQSSGIAFFVIWDRFTKYKKF